ncbi:MAG: extracellular solute-binding protein [Patescibacteria group bacterium]
MKNLSTFQLAILIIFVFLLLLGVLIFAGILPGFRAPTGGTGGEVVMWGTIPRASLADLLNEFNNQHKDQFTLVYQEKDITAIERDFLEAKADNRAPDLLLGPHEILLTERERLVPIPPETYAPRAFLDTYGAASQLFLRGDGTLALPLLLDPLLLYYNRDLLTNAGLPTVPRTWTEFREKATPLTIFDDRRNIIQSAVALGDYRNIPQMKDILSLLLLQAGNPIFDNTGNRPQPLLNETFGFTLRPAAAVLDFYSQFADPARPNYSWNRSLPAAKQSFSRGQSAYYLGPASEWSEIKRSNPRLVFDVAVPPQPDVTTATARITFARAYGVAIVRDGAKVAVAWAAAQALASAAMVERLAETTGLPPARSDLLARAVTDPTLAVFYQAAIVGRNWFDFAPARTKVIFEQMVDSVLTGRLSSVSAVGVANTALDNLVKEVYGE